MMTQQTTFTTRVAVAIAAALLLAATPLARHLPEAPSDLIKRLMHARFSVLSSKGAGGGIMGAKKLTLGFFEDGARIKVKWKAAPWGGEGWNNSPRHEIAAYEIQKLFLDPGEYVVPPVTTGCIPLEDYTLIDDDPKHNLPGADCVYGAISVWLREVGEPDGLFDRKRFQSDGEYAFHLANMNLLAYLINHQDGRKSNFLVAQQGEPRVFSVDNGLSFGFTLHNFFIRHWNSIRVPALPRESVERLKGVTREDLNRLGVLAEMRRRGDGLYRHVPPGENLDPNKGKRLRYHVIQIGLSQKEIRGVEKRIAKLLGKVDNGQIRLMD